MKTMSRFLFSRPVMSLSSRAMSSVFKNRHEGKVAVLTAATDGIGLACAKRLGLEGAKVVLSSRREENVKKAVSVLKEAGVVDVVGTQCHVSSAEDRQKLVQQAISTFGGIDMLIHCAGVNSSIAPFLECPPEAFDKMFDVNVKSAYEMSKLVIPHMKERKGGNIVLMATAASYATNEVSMSLGMYAVSKAALLSLTKMLAYNTATDNIRVNCLCPGLIRTEFAGILYKTDEAHQRAMVAIPMKRLGEPKEMTGIVSFMVSDDASYMTGENISVAGGVASRL